VDLVREIDAIAVGTDQTRVVAMPLDERRDAAQGRASQRGKMVCSSSGTVAIIGLVSA